MSIPLRKGPLFSPEAKGYIEFETGRYSLDWIQMQENQESVPLLRLQGIGEFVIPESVLDAVTAQYGMDSSSPEDKAKAILGKMLELSCQKVYSF